MTPTSTPLLDRPARRAGWVGALAVAAVVLACALPARAQPGAEAPASALRARRAELLPQLRTNSFGEPVVLRTRQGVDTVEGDVWAEVAHPFDAVAAVLRKPAGLCELMFLHLNVRGCTPQSGPEGEALALLVGPKRSGAFDSEYRMRYTMRTEVADAGQVRVTLGAPTGPLSTRDYRIVFEAIPIDAERSFVHLAYAYGYGTLAKMTMGAYLATAGRAKIGFTVEGTEHDGTPRHVRGERAALERNVMRYYLALLAALAPATGTPQQQLQARLADWFARTEKYAEQLHEYDVDEYLREKNEQLARGRLPR
jgi:hypothetical protein